MRDRAVNSTNPCAAFFCHEATKTQRKNPLRLRALVASLTVFIVSVWSVDVQGQNLVPNFSFEQYTICPRSFSAYPHDFRVPGWASANTGTPDYYNKCSWAETNVPKNWAGVSNAHDGVAYVGIYGGQRPGGNGYREYIQTELTQPLQAGKKYRLAFWYKLSSYSMVSIDHMGLALSDTLVKVPHDKVMAAVPVLQVKRPAKNAGGWEQAKMHYIAKGGEKFLVIGNFVANEKLETLFLPQRSGKSAMLGSSAYFYIDEVEVIPLEPLDAPKPVREPTGEPVREPVLWEGKEIEKGKWYVLKNVEFEFDQFTLTTYSSLELDKVVGDILQKQKTWVLELRGHTDDVGGTTYNQELSEKRAKSVAEYLVQNGIDAARLSAFGHGKSQPLVDERTAEARSRNRRVEMRFMDP
mgnify:CR=1 FL=1